MRKNTWLALVLALLLLTACGGQNSGNSDAAQNPVETPPAQTEQQTETPPAQEPAPVAEVFTAADMVGIDANTINLTMDKVDFSQMPHFTNTLGMHDYFLDCIANRCRNIIFTCEKSAMPDIQASAFCEDYRLAWCNPKVDFGEHGVQYIITITYYPGDNVASAYLSGDKTHLTEDELALYDAAVAWLEEYITEEMTDYDKCVTIYNYLSGNVQYSNDLLNALNTSFKFDRGITAYGAMIDHLTICQGYADAFDMLTSMLGMNCTQICGKGGGEPHNWNMIELDGNWYHVDCTWGAAYGGVDNTCTKAYLFCSDGQIGRTHTWDREAYPDAADDSQFYYAKYDLYVTDEAELEEKVGAKLRSGEQVDVLVKNLGEKQVKDYVQSLGAQFHTKEHVGEFSLTAWMP